MLLMLLILITTNLFLIYVGSKVFLPDDVPLSRQRAKRMAYKYKAYIFAIILVFFLNFLENKIFQNIADYLAINSTSIIYSIEGSMVKFAQSFVEPILTGYFFSFYVFVYMFIIIFSLIFYIYSDSLKEVKATTLAFLLNYLIALPFFLFSPVYETWHVINGVSPLIFSVSPIASDFIIGVNGINNCFPSLHTSLAITIATIASFSDKTKWKIFAWFSAISIILSTLYLGIHWISDIIAGIGLGIFSAYIGYKIDYNLDPIDHLLEKIIKKIRR
ncbi:inositol phosphorylceramide synthase [archaeon SCG-AAA382B04]|nr:inositol phosphorylceramide synthase [archaeon SCG-AAA382B04]